MKPQQHYIVWWENWNRHTYICMGDEWDIWISEIKYLVSPLPRFKIPKVNVIHVLIHIYKDVVGDQINFLKCMLYFERKCPKWAAKSLAAVHIQIMVPFNVCVSKLLMVNFLQSGATSNDMVKKISNYVPHCNTFFCVGSLCAQDYTQNAFHPTFLSCTKIH